MASEKYRAWGFGMTKSYDKNLRKYSDAKNLRRGGVGCIHWCVYSIMHMFGIGEGFEFFETDYEVAERAGLNYHGTIENYSHPVYKFEGIFNALMLIMLVTHIINGIAATRMKTYNLFSSESEMFGNIISLCSLGILFTIVASIFKTKRTLAYIFNIGILIVFANTIMAFVVWTSHLFGMISWVAFGIFMLMLEISFETKYGIYTERTNSNTYRPSRPAYTPSVADNGPSLKERINDMLDQEENERKEREQYRTERRRDELNKELRKVSGKIDCLIDENKGRQQMYEKYLKNPKGTWEVDPKANRNKYDAVEKEIAELREKKAKLQRELDSL